MMLSWKFLAATLVVVCTGLLLLSDADGGEAADKIPIVAVSDSSPAIQESCFTRTVLIDHLEQPMELAIAADGRVFFIDRPGTVRVYDPVTGRISRISRLRVTTEHEHGLVGIALDPHFLQNKFIYLFYTPRQAPLHQRVSRFTLGPDSLDQASEKVLLRIPFDREGNSHTGGSLAFDERGNLFISVGDNTSPRHDDGFAALDERPGRLVYDAQRSAANTADLRGKILRIHPEPDGGYSIPDGNLFPKDGSRGRSEIFIMGCRNPFRISYDAPTRTLYWGEIGPDDGKDDQHGPRGYDEFNAARVAGNYGWPYFIADNKAYRAYDFAEDEFGEPFDPSLPTNRSVNNKNGARTLPPAQKAMIWYPYVRSAEFPELGHGGRAAMAGPVYHYDPDQKSALNFPAYYDKKLFVFDWMRNWIQAVSFDEKGGLKRIEPFMGSTHFDKPIDMQFGPDGALYLLEYGESYWNYNTDASLVRIDYNSGNRPPLPVADLSDSLGAAPLRVRFSSARTADPDGDDLAVAWEIGEKEVSGRTPHFTRLFQTPGIYPVTLRVTDARGATATVRKEIRVGNAPPDITIRTTANRSFYWDKEPFPYEVTAKDHEDGLIRSDKIIFFKKYNFSATKTPETPTGSEATAVASEGQALLTASDCRACHLADQHTVAPSFQEIAERYRGEAKAVDRLARKVISGGGGVWGSRAMIAHPQLKLEEAAAMVRFILTFSPTDRNGIRIPSKGTLAPTNPDNRPGSYLLTALYTDAGGKIIGPITGKATLTLRHPKVEAETYDGQQGTRRVRTGGTIAAGSKGPDSYLLFRQIDLKDVGRLTYRYATASPGGTLDVRLDSPTGPLVHTLPLRAGGSWTQASAAVSQAGGLRDLYLVMHGSVNLDWVYFHHKNKATIQ